MEFHPTCCPGRFPHMLRLDQRFPSTTGAVMDDGSVVLAAIVEEATSPRRSTRAGKLPVQAVAPTPENALSAAPGSTVGAASFGSLPSELIALVALFGPLCALRNVVRFDVRGVAATRISRWYRSLLGRKRAWPSVGDRVVLRWPIASNRKPSFATVAGNSGYADGRQMWKICLLNGHYVTAHSVWHLDAWADVDSPGLTETTDWIDSVARRSAMNAASTSRRAAARATTVAMAAMCSTTCPAEAALAVAAASAACTAAAAATSAAHAASSAAGTVAQVSLGAPASGESATLLHVAHHMHEAVAAAGTSSSSMAHHMHEAMEGAGLADDAGEVGHHMQEAVATAEALAFPPHHDSASVLQPASTADAYRVRPAGIRAAYFPPEEGSSPATLRPSAGGVRESEGLGPVPRLLAEAAAAAADAATEATAATHAAGAISGAGSLIVTSGTAAAAMSAAANVRAAAGLLADARFADLRFAGGTGEAASAAAEEMAADAIAEVGLAGRELTATWGPESAVGSSNALSHRAAALLRSIAANRVGAVSYDGDECGLEKDDEASVLEALEASASGMTEAGVGSAPGLSGAELKTLGGDAKEDETITEDGTVSDGTVSDGTASDELEDAKGVELRQLPRRFAAGRRHGEQHQLLQQRSPLLQRRRQGQPPSQRRYVARHGGRLGVAPPRQTTLLRRRLPPLLLTRWLAAPSALRLGAVAHAHLSKRSSCAMAAPLARASSPSSAAAPHDDTHDASPLLPCELLEGMQQIGIMSVGRVLVSPLHTLLSYGASAARNWCASAPMALSGLGGVPQLPVQRTPPTAVRGDGVHLSCADAPSDVVVVAADEGHRRTELALAAVPYAQHKADGQGASGFSLALAMAEHPLDNSSTVLCALLQFDPYQGALFRSSRRFAAHALVALQLAEAELCEAVGLERASLASLQTVDWSQCELSIRQWCLVGWLLQPGQLLGHLQTVRASDASMPIGNWRNEYMASPGFFSRRPRSLVLHSHQGVWKDMALLFSFAAGGSRMPSLLELDLSDCPASDQAMELFQRAISRGAMPNLWALDLSRCSISSRGAASLASALASPNDAAPLTLGQLQYVILTTNRIGDVGACALAQVLSSGAAPSLCELDLCDNPVVDEGAERLLAVGARRDIGIRVDW